MSGEILFKICLGSEVKKFRLLQDEGKSMDKLKKKMAEVFPKVLMMLLDIVS